MDLKLYRFIKMFSKSCIIKTFQFKVFVNINFLFFFINYFFTKNFLLVSKPDYFAITENELIRHDVCSDFLINCLWQAYYHVPQPLQW